MDLTNQLHLFALVMASGLLGMIGHSIRKWTGKETRSPWAWFVRDNYRATVASLIALVTAAVGAMAGDVFANMNILQIVVMCAPWGYANDSVVNKGAPAGEIKPL